MDSRLLIVCLLLVISILLPCLMLLMRSVWNIVPYMYINARVRAKEARLLKPELIETMINAGSVAEIASMLENSEYAPAMQGLVLESAESIEDVLVHQIAAMYIEIAKMLPARAAGAFRFLLQQWDVRNIKTILRGVRRRMPADRIMDRLIPIGELGGERLRKMSESNSVEELLPLFERTPYAPLSAMADAYGQGANLMPLETALDKILLEQMWQQVTADRRLADLRPFFAARIDALNYRILLRAKHDHVQYTQIAPYLIAGGDMPADMPSIYDEVEEIEPLLTELEGTVFYKALIEVLPDYERDGTACHFEKVLDETALQIGNHIAQTQPYGIAPIIAYLTLKEAEVRNVRAIVRAKEAQLDPHAIRDFVLRV